MGTNEKPAFKYPVKSARKRHPIPIEPDTPFRFKATGHSDRKRHLF